MKAGIKKKLYDEKGSTLSFVLIIGMILLLLVASLLTVANSDLTFTQESVESRQGYIDAKSVIEFSKVEINRRMTALNAKDAAIKAETNTVRLTTLQNERKALIAALNNPPTPLFTVYGTTDSAGQNLITESLSLSSGSYNGATKIALGVCTVVPTAINATTNKYTFNLKTQNIRRALDYKVDFDYVVTSFNNWTPITYTPVTKPEIGTWLKTDISAGDRLSIKVDGQARITGSPLYANFSTQNRNLSLDIGKDDAAGSTSFMWLSNNTLNLTAKDICLTDKPPKTKLDGSDFGTSTIFNMTATNIIIPEGLNIGNNVSLKLTCDNLWVGGDIVLGNNSTFTVIGNDNNTKHQMIVDGKIKTERTPNGVPLATDCNINISNLDYFESAGLDIYKSPEFKLTSEFIVIKGDITIEGKGWSDTMLNQISTPTLIKTKYFDCAGKTTIRQIGNPSEPVNIIPYASGDTLNVRFAGGYDQQYAHVDIDKAKNIIFGTSLYLKSNGIDNMSEICWSHLYIEADNVYMEGAADDSIQMSYKSLLYGFTEGSKTINLYNQKQIKYLKSDDPRSNEPVGENPIAAGAYTGKVAYIDSNHHKYFVGIYIWDFLNKPPGAYPANSTSGTSGTGTEKYY